MYNTVSVFIVLVLVGFARCGHFTGHGVSLGNGHISEDVLLATCRYRVNYILDIPASRTVRGLSITKCLMICQNTVECRSFNYGKGTCFILDDFLCSKASNYTLTSTLGMRYCDLLKWPHQEIALILNSSDCTKKGRCDSSCACVTKDTKELCIFPFTLISKQKVYFGCTKDSSSFTLLQEEEPWCSTRVNEYGYHVDGHSGICSDWCQIHPP